MGALRSLSGLTRSHLNLQRDGFLMNIHQRDAIISRRIPSQMGRNSDNQRPFQHKQTRGWSKQQYKPPKHPVSEKFRFKLSFPPIYSELVLMEPAERSRGDPAEIVNHQQTCYFWTEKLKRSEVKLKIKCWEDVYKGINHLPEKHPINFLLSTFWRSGTSKPGKGSPVPNRPEGFLWTHAEEEEVRTVQTTLEDTQIIRCLPPPKKRCP